MKLVLLWINSTSELPAIILVSKNSSYIDIILKRSHVGSLRSLLCNQIFRAHLLAPLFDRFDVPRTAISTKSRNAPHPPASLFAPLDVTKDIYFVYKDRSLILNVSQTFISTASRIGPHPPAFHAVRLLWKPAHPPAFHAVRQLCWLIQTSSFQQRYLAYPPAIAVRSSWMSPRHSSRLRRESVAPTSQCRSPRRGCCCRPTYCLDPNRRKWHWAVPKSDRWILTYNP